MENTKELVLIHADMKQVSQSYAEGVNIMLTPQLYTMKREEIPVKYSYQAKRIAPSLFEGLLEEPEAYKYFVEKEDEAWLFIAYNPEEIKAILEKKGILPEQVSKIYFAQQAVEHFSRPVLLGDKEALVNLGGTMTIIPQIALNADEQSMQITRDFTPKKGVAFEGRGKSFISTNEAYTLAAICALFAVIYFVEGSRYGGDGEAQEAQMQTLLENYPSLQSSYTRKSIASKYKAIDTKERKKRDVIKSLSHMIFKGSKLSSLSINDNKFKAEFACKDASVTSKLKELAKKEKFNTSKIANSNDLKIEGTL
ncbi:MAG: hypothetical protein FAF03_11325 [Epsilonproteobacteria bacterium]|nr:hypothetical protein [Campylobacterota bacterium]